MQDVLTYCREESRLKTSIFVLVLLFALQTVGFAASGSKVKSSTPPPVPKAYTSGTATSPNSTATAEGYKPAAPQGTASTAKSAQSQPAQNGGFLKNIGMLGGGMLLGGMLGSLLGFGHNSMMASLINILFVGVLVLGAFYVARQIWSRYRVSRMKQEPPKRF